MTRDPAEAAIRLAYNYETRVAYPHMEALTDKNKQLTDKMKKINELLQKIQQIKAKTPSHKEPVVDFSQDPVMMDLLDEVRKLTTHDIHGQPTSFLPPGEHKWNGQGAVDALVEGLNAQIKLCQHEVSPNITELTHKQHQYNHFMEIGSAITKRDDEGKKHSIRNASHA